jgi:hypothetical protein
VTNNTQLYRTREWSGNVNASLPTHLIGNSDELKFGVAFRRRTNTHAYNPYTSTAAPSVPLSAVTEPGTTYYYQDHYADGPNISIPAARALWANGTGAGFATNAAANSFGGLAVQQDNREDVYAGYVQEQVKFGRVSLIGGLRIEHTSAVYNGNTTVPTNSSSATTDRGGQTATYNGSTLIPVSSRASYTNFFLDPGPLRGEAGPDPARRLFQHDRPPRLQPDRSGGHDRHRQQHRHLGQSQPQADHRQQLRSVG